jgi:hypothetical protein
VRGSAASRRGPDDRPHDDHRALDTLLVLAVIAIAAAVVALVAAPLVRGEDSAAGRRADRLAELEARKEAKYREIRDAQNDLRAGKLSPDDHRALDRGLRREAVEILAEIDRVEGTAEGGTEEPG